MLLPCASLASISSIHFTLVSTSINHSHGMGLVTGIVDVEMDSREGFLGAREMELLRRRRHVAGFKCREGDLFRR